MYYLKWPDKQIDNMLNVAHRHAVYGVVWSYYQGSYEVGLIAVVHTFESDLKSNSHIHALFTEGGIGKNNKGFKKVSYYIL